MLSVVLDEGWDLERFRRGGGGGLLWAWGLGWEDLLWVGFLRLGLLVEEVEEDIVVGLLQCVGVDWLYFDLWGFVCKASLMDVLTGIS